MLMVHTVACLRPCQQVLFHRPRRKHEQLAQSILFLFCLCLLCELWNGAGSTGCNFAVVLDGIDTLDQPVAMDAECGGFSVHLGAIPRSWVTVAT